MSRQKEHAVSQITLDNDFNVPDIKPDIDTLILDRGEIQIEDVRPEKGRIILKGMLVAGVLYAADRSIAKVEAMECRIPFEEILHMESMEPGDNLKVDWEIEDLNVSMIHSRKVSIRAIVTFIASAEIIYDAELACGFSKGETVQTLTEELEVLGLCMTKKDTYRIKDELILAGNQANIRELLWKDISLCGAETRLMENKISVKGELEVFALYEGENEEQLQWITGTLPFAGNVDLPGCRPEMIGDIRVDVIKKNMEVKPDYDGEERVLQVEVLLGLDIRIYEEIKVELLTDAYSLSEELILEHEPVKLDRLVLKNFSKARFSERIAVKQTEHPVLQVCHTTGKVIIEEVKMTPTGLVVEGVIFVQVLYITSNDRVPVLRSGGGIPFTHILEVPGIDETCKYSLKGELEQITAVMVDSKDAEIRASVNFYLMVCSTFSGNNIKKMEEHPMDWKKIRDLPGVVGCVIGEGDTLWDIAKKYHTTTGHICSLNQMPSEQIKVGDKVLVMKSVENV